MNEILSPIVDRLVEQIEAIPDIGMVQGFNPFARDDIRPLIVSEINGVPTLRAWWVQGPTMEAQFVTELSPPSVARTWTFEVHGIEGVPDGGEVRRPGEELNTLRDNAAAVTDALDADDLDMGGLIFRAWPCEWVDEPTHVAFGPSGDTWVVAYAVITKRIMTMRART